MFGRLKNWLSKRPTPEPRPIAPNRDIDKIIAAAEQVHPGMKVEQLKVKFPGVDDDGLWFFAHPATGFETQLESPYGMLPFLVETTRNDSRLYVDSIPEALRAIESGLGIGVEEN
jgi:hypothetical protein